MPTRRRFATRDELTEMLAERTRANHPAAYRVSYAELPEAAKDTWRKPVHATLDALAELGADPGALVKITSSEEL